MKLNEVTREIILVSGRLCSGKGHFCAQMYPGYHIITVSSVVKSLISSNKRSDTEKTAHLDQQIIEQLIKQISQHNKVVVEGVRQPSIVRGLQDHFGPQIVDMVWLDVPEDVRRERFERRARSGDDQPFDKAGLGDEALGIGDVEKIFRSSGRVAQN